MNMKFNSACCQLLIILLVVPIVFVYAQQENPVNNSEQKQKLSKENEQEQPDTAKPPTEEEVVLPGDVIYLKSGKKITGVQVLRELPDKIEVQVNEKIEPMTLPRRMVKSIEYDNRPFEGKAPERDIVEATTK
jgi:hypothetical protein